MIIPEHEIRESAIEGRGVFLKSNVKKGELLVIYTYGISELIHKEYHDQVCLDLENSPHRDVVDSSVRYVDNWFIFDSYSKHNLCFGSREGDFVNHSFEPAMIYHCGLCFAARDLKAGDELTVDYRYFMSEDLRVSATGTRAGRYAASAGARPLCGHCGSLTVSSVMNRFPDTQHKRQQASGK